MAEPENPRHAFADLPDSHRRPIADAHIVKAADRNEIAHLTIRVRPKTPFSALQTAVAGIYAKPLAERQFLTREALAQTHGAATADLYAVEHLARTHGLSVTRRSEAQRSLVLTGKLQALLDLFPADLRHCRVGKQTYRGRQGKIQIPSPLAGIVTGIFGYDTRPRQRARRPGASAMAGVEAGGGVAATDCARRYNFPDAAAGKVLDGAGTCIGLIELGGNYRGRGMTCKPIA